MSHDDLIKIAQRWLFSYHRCGVVITDMTSGSPETPDAIGWRAGLSWLVECKASRADFFADRKKHFRVRSENAMGAYRYFMCPSEMLQISEIPSGWGLLWARPNSVTVMIDAPTVAARSCRYEIDILTSALRRMVLTEKVQGVACRVYQVDGSGDPRATIAVSAP
jgi:hypothetical protein